MSTASTTTMKDFSIITKLGEGSFSSVFKVRRLSDGLEYALKKVKIAALSEKEKENALNEVRILASITDPNIVGYKEAFFEDSPLTLCIVMEHAGGGDFYQKITDHQKRGTHFSEKEIWKYFTQMCKGLKTLHDMNILHRDLKCANVFLSTDKTAVKLGDLNVSKVAKSALVYTQTGTPYYASPEVWSDKPYDKKSDIWSLGCIIYEMCALKPPFRAPDMRGLYNKVVKGIYDKIPSQYSSDLSNAIAACLKVNPAVRPSVDEILAMPEFLKNARDDLAPMSKKSSRGSLLNTIKLPKNIRAVMLPKANYDSADEEKDDSRRESLLPPIVKTPGRSPRSRADKPRALSGKESTRQASLDVNAYRHESRGAMPPRGMPPTSAMGIRASHDLPPTRPPLHPMDHEEKKGPSVMAPKPPMPGKPNYERISSGRDREDSRKKTELISRANNILQPTDPVIVTPSSNYVNKNMNYVAATPVMPEARRASPGPNYKAAYPNWWG